VYKANYRRSIIPNPLDAFKYQFANTFGFRFSEQIFLVSTYRVGRDKRFLRGLWTRVSVGQQSHDFHLTLGQ